MNVLILTLILHHFPRAFSFQTVHSFQSPQVSLETVFTLGERERLHTESYTTLLPAMEYFKELG